jgi:DNA repair exonuclease SbcCD ATPase subunit
LLLSILFNNSKADRQETESKVGKGINLFLLDEPFVGLDSVSCLSALELLKSIDSNKKIIIVDHNPEVKESISDKILVKRDGVSSEIVII